MIFINQEFAWNVMPERDMPGLWISPERFKELRLTLEANKTSLEKEPEIGWYIAYLHGSCQYFQVRKKGCFHGGWQRNSGHFGEPQEFEEFTQTYRYCRRSLIATQWYGFFALRD